MVSKALAFALAILILERLWSKILLPTWTSLKALKRQIWKFFADWPAEIRQANAEIEEQYQEQDRKEKERLGPPE